MNYLINFKGLTFGVPKEKLDAFLYGALIADGEEFESVGPLVRSTVKRVENYGRDVLYVGEDRMEITTDHI